MKATIDKAGRVVIPKAIRDQVGIQAGAVEIRAEGASIRIQPVANDTVTEQRGRLVIPPSGNVLTEEVVRALRDAGQR